MAGRLGFRGGLNVNVRPWGHVYTRSPADLCYFRRWWNLLEMQPPLKEVGHWGRALRFYSQVVLRVHSLMPYLQQAASCCVVTSSLPRKTKHFLNWGAEQTLILLSCFLDIWSQQWEASTASVRFNLFIHLFNIHLNTCCGPHCVPGTGETAADQTKTNRKNKNKTRFHLWSEPSP